MKIVITVDFTDMDALQAYGESLYSGIEFDDPAPPEIGKDLVRDWAGEVRQQVDAGQEPDTLWMTSPVPKTVTVEVKESDE